MKEYFLKFNDYEPKYIQISDKFIELMNNGIVDDNQKLPTIRELSNFYSVNKDTIVKAYKRLESQGYATQKIGSGTYSKVKNSRKSFKKNYSNAYKEVCFGGNKFIDLTGENSGSELFPIDSFKEVLNEVIDRDRAEAFMSKESLGYKGLRESISKEFWKKKIPSSDILIVSGAQQGIDIIAKSIINVNDNIIVEKPTYMGAISVFSSRKANIFEVRMDEDGVNIEELIKVLKKSRIKCYYTMTYFQNPTGISHSIEKKKQLIGLASKYDFYIIEDDYLSELIYNDKERISLKSLDKFNRVIYIKSFSKIFLPGIRLGYMVSPAKLKEQIVSCKVNTDIATSSLMQRAFDLYLRKGYWMNHINKIVSQYKEAYFRFENIVRDELETFTEVIYPMGGLSFYFKIKSRNINSIILFEEASKKNILITPGVLFYRTFDNGLYYFRISFSNCDYEQFVEGIKELKNIFIKYEG